MKSIEWRRSSLCRLLTCRLSTWATIAACVLIGAADLLAAEAAKPVESAAAPRVSPFNANADDRNAEAERLLAAMTLEEKIGQMCQVWPETGELTPAIRDSLRKGEIGSLINCATPELIAESQRLVREESRLGVPLLIGRDVVHGYRTVFPIPLGQAASWNPELIEQAASVAAAEARSQGVNWTFAPMVDVARDPRWGRVAETLGEDPRLTCELAAAMVRGFQQERDGRVHGLIACAKHFAAYGLAEGGRDYNRASLSIADLHNIHLPPFAASFNVGCRTVMTTFSEINGVPGTAHAYLLRNVLCDAWRFGGVVVSDWNSVIEMVTHGHSSDESDAARQAVNAGVHMEMVSTAFHTHLAQLAGQGAVELPIIDDAVRRILRLKLDLAATAENAATGEKSELPGAIATSELLRPRSLELARRVARESMVLLKNEGDVLPLRRERLRRVAVIGPMADASLSQLGCWAVDGRAADSITPLAALQDALGESVEITHVRGAATSYAEDAGEIESAKQVAAGADVVLLFVGEDAVLSGEARSRSTLELPGVQPELVQAVAAAGKPVVLVVLAGRPLTIGKECNAADAVLYAWHPGTMGGPAIADILLGIANPCGKLPVSMPKHVGQVPLYYSHSNTGRPSPADYRPLTASQGPDLPVEFQFRSHYVDGDPFPLFPFGYGLSFARYEYDGFELGTSSMSSQQTLAVRARVTNVGSRAGVEIVQLYVRDLAAAQVRPVRELKAFRRVYLRPGESQRVEFAITANDLRYFDNEGRQVLEPGKFAVWIGGDSTATLGGEFELTGDGSAEQRPAAVARAPEEDLPTALPATAAGADDGA